MGAVNATVTALTHWCPQRRALGETITVEGAGETITVEGATSDAPTNAKISSSTTPPSFSSSIAYLQNGTPEGLCVCYHQHETPDGIYIWKIRRTGSSAKFYSSQTPRSSTLSSTL